MLMISLSILTVDRNKAKHRRNNRLLSRNELSARETPRV
jgi:hypothetical protein